eukprot:TRINITY_DN2112_c0_g1_i1.p1 TRINITY_DN2112_c0_g1~~TRINITY_DN2112_c0_g1_i1.p1  ORF type:complete len:556 (+),score=86.75 TRINITY_DN2112_c0_g1_i1:90-1757(+)
MQTVECLTKTKNFVSNCANSITWILTSAFIYFGQNLLAPNLTSCAVDLKIEDKKDLYLGGALTLGYFIAGLPIVMLIGRKIDTTNDRRLYLLMLCAANGVFCLATGWVTKFWELLIVRILSGIPAACVNPLLLSLLNDDFLPENRSKAAFCAQTSMGVGFFIGQIIAGKIGPTYGWKSPFILNAILCFSILFFIYFKTVEPERPARGEELASSAIVQSSPTRPRRNSITYSPIVPKTSPQNSSVLNSSNPFLVSPSTNNPYADLPQQLFEDEILLDDCDVGGTLVGVPGRGRAGSLVSLAGLAPPIANDQTFKESVKEVFAVPTNAIICTQGIVGTIPLAVMAVFMTDFLSLEKGLSVESSSLIMVVFGVGAAVGMAVGSGIGDKLYKKKKCLMTIFLGVATIIGVLPMLHVINVPFQGGPDPELMVYIYVVVAGALVNVSASNVKAILIHVNPGNLVATVVTFQNTTASIGRGIGPIFIQMFMSANEGRKRAFNISMSCWIVCGLMFLWCALYIKHDAETVSQRKNCRKRKLPLDNGTEEHNPLINSDKLHHLV